MSQDQNEVVEVQEDEMTKLANFRKEQEALEEMETNKALKAQEDSRKRFESDIQNMDAEELIKFLHHQNRSDVYIIMRDMVTTIQKKTIKNDMNLARLWKALETEGKLSWDYDHKTATMLDVNRACTQVYTAVVNMIKALNDGSIQAEDAINRLEAHLGLPTTVFGPEVPQQPVHEEEVANVENESGEQKDN